MGYQPMAGHSPGKPGAEALKAKLWTGQDWLLLSRGTLWAACRKEPLCPQAVLQETLPSSIMGSWTHRAKTQATRCGYSPALTCQEVWI